MAPAMSITPSAFNLRPPLYDQIVGANGVPTQIETTWRTNLTLLLQAISPIQVSISGGDATAGLRQAIGQAAGQGGGVVVLPAGSYTISAPVVIAQNSPPIWIMGAGPATILTRSVAMPAGAGIFDISSDYVTLSDFVIDGGITVAVGLQYNGGFSTAINLNDPMAPSLTTNTSVWVHGPATNFAAYRMRFQHAGGYSILLDATSGDISDVDIVNCRLVNNRPTLFGAGGGPQIYGSWNGGILAAGDGRASVGAQSGTVNDLLVHGCSFARSTGNCVWSSLYGLVKLHSEFRIQDNRFLDCGLDGIEMGGVIGGIVEGNVLRRIGYICTDDTSQSVPAWLAGLNATGIDSSGLVKSVNYESNSLLSVNGGFIDADGHCDSSMSGNVCRIPVVGEEEYTEDSIAISGSANAGSTSYGINFSNSSQTPWGAQNVVIVTNSLLNIPAGAIRLYAARFCTAQANIINAPANSINPPIAFGPVGAGPYQRCYSLRISGNFCTYSPAASGTPLVLEDQSISAMTGGEINFVFSNNPIIGNGDAVEFVKAAGSGSTVWPTTVWS
jgi:hypothetical protein